MRRRGRDVGQFACPTFSSLCYKPVFVVARMQSTTNTTDTVTPSKLHW